MTQVLLSLPLQKFLELNQNKTEMYRMISINKESGTIPPTSVYIL